MLNQKITHHNFEVTERKWQQIWHKENCAVFDNESDKPKYYVLEMLPYPSGNLHMGHVRNYTMGDVIARFKMMHNYNVLHPMGWDAFGLPAENAAIENHCQPHAWILRNIDAMREQQKRLGLLYDWNREVITCMPAYYKHEQKIFLDFYHQGLAYQRDGLVNWDPVDHTVLANEQIVDGKGWRSGAIVEQKKMRQWYLRISDYAQELLDSIEGLSSDWPKKVCAMQANWIGRSEGIIIEFPLRAEGSGADGSISVFTTRPETMFGASFVAISFTHALATQIAKENSEVCTFVKRCQENAVALRGTLEQRPEGIFTGLYCDHPLKNASYSFDDIGVLPDFKPLPVFIADFVVAEHGSGAVFGCPAHDERDFRFAQEYQIPLRRVIFSYKDAVIETKHLLWQVINHGPQHTNDTSLPRKKGLIYAQDGSLKLQLLCKGTKQDTMPIEVGVLVIHRPSCDGEGKLTIDCTDLHQSSKALYLEALLATIDWLFGNYVAQEVLLVFKQSAMIDAMIKLHFVYTPLEQVNDGTTLLTIDRKLFANTCLANVQEWDNVHTCYLEDGFVGNSYFLNADDASTARSRIINILSHTHVGQNTLQRGDLHDPGFLETADMLCRTIWCSDPAMIAKVYSLDAKVEQESILSKFKASDELSLEEYDYRWLGIIEQKHGASSHITKVGGVMIQMLTKEGIKAANIYCDLDNMAMKSLDAQQVFTMLRMMVNWTFGASDINDVTLLIVNPKQGVANLFQEAGFRYDHRIVNDLHIGCLEVARLSFYAKQPVIGAKKISYKLRDWCVSRQRYWGCPIPIVYCTTCGTVAEKPENLPITLPEDAVLDGSGNPLAKHPLWKHCICPQCGGPATRETDTLDTFFESSWYFLRYISPSLLDRAFDKGAVDSIMPVDQYIGGIEHAILHLLYARFFVKALKQCGYLNFEEPFQRLMTQGMICYHAYRAKDGTWISPECVKKTDEGFINSSNGEILELFANIKMSKSKKNVIDPEHILSVYGADAARMFVLSDTPADRDLEWSSAGIDAVFKYINRLWKLAHRFKYVCDQHHASSDICDDVAISSDLDKKLRRILHYSVKAVTSDIEAFQFNKAIAHIHELSNAIEDLDFTEQHISILREAINKLFMLLSPITPHLSEEVWQLLGNKGLLLRATWPKYCEDYLLEDELLVIVQINGKMRGKMIMSADSDKVQYQAAALALPNVAQILEGKIIKKVIVVPNRIVNLVI